MSLSSIAYRQVDTIVSSWTTKYQYHISLLENQQKFVKFMVQFSLTKPEKPIPVGTVRVYFTCKCEGQMSITFRFQKDSLIHSVDKTIRHKQIQKWIDDALAKKLLVRQTVFYLGTSYEQTRVKDERLDKLLQKKPVVQQQEYVYISPELLDDQQRSIQILQKRSKDKSQLERDLKMYFREIDTQNLGVVTRPQLIKIIQNLGLKLSESQQTEVLKRVDKDNTGTVQYTNYQQIVSQILQAKQSKREAEDLLQIKKDQQTFTSVLTLINDETQDIQAQIVDHFRSQDEDETGITNISEVKSCLQKINNKFKQQKRNQPLTPIQMAEITKILTDLYGYKSIPYVKIHDHIIEYKIKTFSTGLVNSKMTKLELYLREICEKYDDKKFGRIKADNLIKAIQESQKIKLTKAQVYLLENILPVDTKNEVSYAQISKFLAELIKKFYIHSSKKKQ